MAKAWAATTGETAGLVCGSKGRGRRARAKAPAMGQGDGKVGGCARREKHARREKQGAEVGIGEARAGDAETWRGRKHKRIIRAMTTMGERAAGGSLCRCGARTSGGGQRCGCGSQRPTRVVHFPSAFCFLPCPCSLLPPPFFLLPSPFSLIPYPFSLPPTPFPYPEYCSTERATNNCSIQDCSKHKNADIFCADRCVVFLFVVRR